MHVNNRQLSTAAHCCGSLPYHTANDKKLLGKKLDCVHLTHKVNQSVEPALISYSVASVGTRSQLKELVQ